MSQETQEANAVCLAGDNLQVHQVEEIASEQVSELLKKCKGNACGKLRIVWSRRDDRYRMYNEGEKWMRVKMMETNNVFGCPFVERYDIPPGDYEITEHRGYCPDEVRANWT